MHISFEEVFKMAIDFIPGIAMIVLVLALVFGGGLKELFELYATWMYG